MPLLFVLFTIFVCGCQTVNEVVTLKRQPVPKFEQPLYGLIHIEGRGIYFKPGATQHEVRLVMGEPTKIEQNIWFYGDSTVTFSVSVKIPVVSGYHVRATPLLIYDKDPFSI